jgi:hypothetical protein
MHGFCHTEVTSVVLQQTDCHGGLCACSETASG